MLSRRSKLHLPTESEKASLRASELSKPISDAVRWTHYLGVNAFAILAQFVSILSFDWGRYPGIRFICETIDRPVYTVVKLFEIQPGDGFLPHLLAFQLTAVPATLLYGFAVYCIAWPIVWLANRL
jgi:hypothetical protein